MPSQHRLTFEAPTQDPTLTAVLQVAERLEAVAKDVAVLRQAIGINGGKSKTG